jgi:hypothetical protein
VSGDLGPITSRVVMKMVVGTDGGNNGGVGSADARVGLECQWPKSELTGVTSKAFTK